MGNINCFPNDQAEDEIKDKQKGETEKTDPTPAPAGVSQAAEGDAQKALTKLDRAKVDAVWTEIRGDGDRPSDDFIKKAIKKDDLDSSGVLQKEECKRLCESFLLRAKKNGDVFSSWDHVFQFLDKNDDETLDFEDVRYTMTVMWLMTKDGVSLQRVNIDTKCEDTAVVAEKGSATDAAEDK